MTLCFLDQLPGGSTLATTSLEEKQDGPSDEIDGKITNTKTQWESENITVVLEPPPPPSKEKKRKNRNILIKIGPFRNKQDPFRFLLGPFRPK